MEDSDLEQSLPDEFICPVSPSGTRVKDLVCRCPAYTFPHRFLGGKCRGKDFVRWYWYNNPQPTHGEECQHCGACNTENIECEVLTGQEPISMCQAVVALKRYFS